MTDPSARTRRSLLALALSSPLALLGCGGSPDGSHVQVGDATKAEVQARSEVYKKARAAKKSKAAPRR